MVRATPVVARGRGDVEERGAVGIVAFILWFFDDMIDEDRVGDIHHDHHCLQSAEVPPRLSLARASRG